MNYAVTLAFDGTAYCGWQVQNNAISIQQTVQDAAEKVFGIRPNVTGCSRTDSGVHAREYVCVISDVAEISETGLPLALNSILPSDISALKAKAVSEDFHPRYSCIEKEYEYVIWNSRIKNVYFGAYDKKAGSFGSIVNLADLPYNHKPNIVGGVLEKECSNILSEFFKQLRSNKKKSKTAEE